jgi:hypothetical protein
MAAMAPHSRRRRMQQLANKLRYETVIKSKKLCYYFAGSRRVLATAVEDWLENLFALAPVRAYAYVQ